jgi:hypothetical protein
MNAVQVQEKIFILVLSNELPINSIIYCNCNLFAIHTSKIGYKPVDIDTVTYILFSIIYIVD